MWFVQNTNIPNAYCLVKSPLKIKKQRGIYFIILNFYIYHCDCYVLITPYTWQYMVFCYVKQSQLRKNK